MSPRFAGPMIGGPCAGGWIESQGPVAEAVQTTSVRLPSGPWPGEVQHQEIKLQSHVYIYERWPTPDGDEIGAFRHESIKTKADMLRELLIHYRPLSKAKRI